MKKFTVLFITVIVLLLPAYSHSSVPGSLRTSFVEGEVQVKAENASDWMTALVNMPLMEGDVVNVQGSGRLEIQLNDGSFLRLDENSSLTIHPADRRSLQFHLNEGRAYINFKGLDDVSIQVETPNVSVRAGDDSRFSIELLRPGRSEISVFRGVVHTESRNGTVRVRAGNTLTLEEGDFADVSPLGVQDEWERWNKNRDREFDKEMYSSRYLPEELKYYSYDFDNNGKWVHTSDYGYVWTPTVIVSSHWSPYRLGRWGWFGDDYVWISYEPWGWAPYHYGRWSFSVSIGWFWVPPARRAVYWSPGYVGWVHTPDYVAWIPLAPGDTYYGYGYYGPWSVNIIDIDIHKTVIKNVYKNVYVNNAATIVDRGSFKKGRYADFRLKKNPFLRDEIYVSRPDVKPGRKSSEHIMERGSHTQPEVQPLKDRGLIEPGKRITRTEQRQRGVDFEPVLKKEKRTGLSSSQTERKSRGDVQMNLPERRGVEPYTTGTRQKARDNISSWKKDAKRDSVPASRSSSFQTGRKSRSDVQINLPERQWIEPDKSGERHREYNVTRGQMRVDHGNKKFGNFKM